MSKVFEFESQPYLQALPVEVLAVEPRSDHWIVLLDNTILYPEGGGQPSDNGYLNDLPVSRVDKTEAGLEHVLESPIEPGPASLVVNWARRFDHMQQHTAQHVLTRCALDAFGWATRSFHIGPQVSDIELDCPPPQPDEVEALEDAVARVIAQARPIRGFRVSTEEYESLDVRSRGLPAGHRGDIRLVEIDGFDLNTCGGTHLASTSEIETLKVLNSEALRGGCRLHWVAGKRVRGRLAKQGATMAALRQALGIGDDEMVAGIELKLDQLQQARRTQRWLEKRLAESMVESLAQAGDRFVDLHLSAAESGLLRPIAELLSNETSPQVTLVTAEGDGGHLFAIVFGRDSSLDLQAAGSAIAEILEGRGGGSGQIFQGKAKSLDRRPEAVDSLKKHLL